MKIPKYAAKTGMTSLASSKLYATHGLTARQYYCKNILQLTANIS